VWPVIDAAVAQTCKPLKGSVGPAFGTRSRPRGDAVAAARYGDLVSAAPFITRGRGLARRLSSVVANASQQRVEQVFLHAWTTNHAAIALYESLGFELRAAVQVAVLEVG
jgi:hypothetical protein